MARLLTAFLVAGLLGGCVVHPIDYDGHRHHDRHWGEHHDRGDRHWGDRDHRPWGDRGGYRYRERR
ncbi:hypothetical protein [Aromatoleum sp.]|uniref:hypothetical protein n=1 Tax=Aromatoleum sp. TaxID=2307007 RepID=UPI002FC936C2